MTTDQLIIALLCAAFVAYVAKEHPTVVLSVDPRDGRGCRDRGGDAHVGVSHRWISRSRDRPATGSASDPLLYFAALRP